MTYEELISAVAKIIQDDSFSDSDIGIYLNQAQREVAGGMQSSLGSWITPPLPKLLTIDTITTDIAVAHVDMPLDFHRNLQFVASAEGYEIDIADSFITFSETYPLLNQTGRISEVCAFGGQFYYQGIPIVAEDVTIHYYREPTEMVDYDDEPTSIPSHLQKPLLVNHAAWKIYEQIEDDFQEAGQNIQRYQVLFFQALRLLELSIPYDTRGMMLI